MNKSWRQHPTRHQLYGNLPPLTKTIQVRRTRHAGHCWRSRDELINDVLLWTPTHGRTKAGRPARTYIQQLCEDTGCSPEDLPEAMNDMEKWRERVRDIRATSTTWWWWWWYLKCSTRFVYYTHIHYPYTRLQEYDHVSFSILNSTPKYTCFFKSFIFSFQFHKFFKEYSVSFFRECKYYTRQYAVRSFLRLFDNILPYP